MKRIAIVLAVAMLAAGAGTAAAGTTKQQRTSAAPLQAQINKLNATVKSLQATVKKLQAETARILNAPELKARLAAQGIDVDTIQGAEFGRFIREENVRWGKVIREANIKVE